MNINWKTVFVEYGFARRGQHFMTVIETFNHKRIIVGRVSRHYDSQTKKYKYSAVDFAGNQIFVDHHDLQDLKKQFKLHGKSLAENVLLFQKQAIQPQKRATAQIANRSEEIKNIRQKRSTQSIARVVSNTNRAGKINENQKEKAQDNVNPVKHKDAPLEKNEDNMQVNEQEPGTPELERQHAEEPEKDHVSEREDELSQAREQGNDMEEDIER